MDRKAVLQDAIGVWILLTFCLIAGIVLNEIRSTPLPLTYSSPLTRLDQTVERLKSAPVPPVAVTGDVDRDEMQQISSNGLALILDARPEVFYRLGHIPSALSLPRDDFENAYRTLQAKLGTYHDKPVVVYCSSSECQDSQMVAQALRKLGYEHVRLFRGGWGEWENSNLPEEKE